MYIQSLHHNNELIPEQHPNEHNPMFELLQHKNHMSQPARHLVNNPTHPTLQFHYFKMYDAGSNNMLDGCELIKSLVHWHEQGHNDPNNPTPNEEKISKDDELQQLTDPTLKMDYDNKDGFIDYPEFLQAQQKAGGGGRQPS
jgi:hypothetical protein